MTSRTRQLSKLSSRTPSSILPIQFCAEVPVRGANASRVLVSASRRNELRLRITPSERSTLTGEVRDREDALASTLVLSAQTKIACSLARVAASFSSYGYEPNSIRSSRSASGNGLAGETSQGRGHSDRRVE